MHLVIQYLDVEQVTHAFVVIQVEAVVVRRGGREPQEREHCRQSTGSRLGRSPCRCVLQHGWAWSEPSHAREGTVRLRLVLPCGLKGSWKDSMCTDYRCKLEKLVKILLVELSLKYMIEKHGSKCFLWSATDNRATRQTWEEPGVVHVLLCGLGTVGPFQWLGLAASLTAAPPRLPLPLSGARTRSQTLRNGEGPGVIAELWLIWKDFRLGDRATVRNGAGTSRWVVG